MMMNDGSTMMSLSWISSTHWRSFSTAVRRRLDLAIVGLPNSGKSSLLNVLTESTVSAVSRKRHTTRQGVLGARTVNNNVQLLFLDTPGFLRAPEAKRERLVDRQHLAVSSMIPSVDHTLLVVDAARRLTDPVKETLIELMLLALQAEGRDELAQEEAEEDEDDDEAKDDNDDTDSDDKTTKDDAEETASDDKTIADDDTLLQRKFSVVLNKIDLVHPKSDLLDVATEIDSLAETCLEKVHGSDNKNLHERMPMFFYISALKNDGIDNLLQYLLDMATPCSVWEIEPGASTDLTPEERVEEIVREKIYRCLHKEVPYQIQQRNTLFRVTKDSSVSSENSTKLGVVVHQELVVRTKSHLELVRGSGGRTLERIRESAERDLERIFGCKVVLQLHIKHMKSKQR